MAFKKYRLKRDLPWAKAGEIFENKGLSEWYWLKGDDRLGIPPDHITNTSWFEPINPFSPLEGEWVFNEKSKTACKILPHEQHHSMHPQRSQNSFYGKVENECTLEAVQSYPDTYKRYAQPHEVEASILENFPFVDANGHFRVVRINPVTGEIWLKTNIDRSKHGYIGNLRVIWNHFFGLSEEPQEHGGMAPSYKMRVTQISIGCSLINKEMLERAVLTFRSYHEQIGDWGTKWHKLFYGNTLR